MKYYKIFLLIILISFCTLSLNCDVQYIIKLFKFNSYKYSGDINFTKYGWLKGKKIFLDPGHGGQGENDRFRIGPDGITEEEVNLRVALILADMLGKAGVVVSMSREKDDDIPLPDRVDKANKFTPDLIISLHHNGSIRPSDNVNYPLVFIWGNKKVGPMSYSFAEILLDEFQRIMGEKGLVLSDFSIFKETGTMILRETRYTCPGVIGEPGFFSDIKHAKRLNDVQYNQEEAEAYFYAIARFFERGIPKAEVWISSPADHYNSISEKNPIIAIKADSGIEGVGVIKDSLSVTLDDVQVKYKAVTDNLFFIDYGTVLCPGVHSIRFSFKNQRNQSSMIYCAGFTAEIKKGDHERLAVDGAKLLQNKLKQKEGLKMLLSAFSMGPTDPDADSLIWNIARGFDLIGDKVNSEYYYAKLVNFYPQSKYAKKLEPGFKGYRFPVEYNGKPIKIQYEPSLKDESKKQKK